MTLSNVYIHKLYKLVGGWTAQSTFQNIDEETSPDESDAFHRRLSGATSGRRLPPAQRWRLRKLADTKVRMKVMSLNIGTMTGKSRELADTMTRRNIDIACIQETRWKGAKFMTGSSQQSY